eukprot:CAMPEP_0176330064 /NCGR_PEP_ID=MMETSP0121_2-20121125/75820_1 /TAXON_ID=160619 /ORGANISM="Kryptoperidinium foliaceum, Strain CCMP 1326" /LENGTH=50 /DNA_ID=CAMNT_0017672823 /DNA_START=13 /DNA_END=162 /DNA_ORIENTATION=+
MAAAAASGMPMTQMGVMPPMGMGLPGGVHSAPGRGGLQGNPMVGMGMPGG